SLRFCPSSHLYQHQYLSFFLTNAPAPTHIYTLSLHDALPISIRDTAAFVDACRGGAPGEFMPYWTPEQPYMEQIKRNPAPLRIADRKSTRLNSSHVSISYAVFCLKKKKNNKYTYIEH